MPHGGRRPGAGRKRKAPPRSSLDTAIIRSLSAITEHSDAELESLGLRGLVTLIRRHGLEAMSEIENEPEASVLDFLKTLRPPESEPLPAVVSEPEVEVTLRNDLAINGIRYAGRCLVPESMAAELVLADARRTRALRMSPVAQDRPLEP